MAAGSGFKTFATGDVLTAADTNGYLMQGVWVFASAAARTSAVTSPQEGNMSYLKDTNSTEYYDGAAWVAIGGSGASGPAFIAYASATQTLSAGVATKIAANTEIKDSDSCYNTTNYRFTPNKAGVYQVSVTQMFNGTPARVLNMIYKNGANTLAVIDFSPGGSDGGGGGTALIDMNGTTDYLEFYVYSSATPICASGSANNRFAAVWIRS
jgi:hypothetical protein